MYLYKKNKLINLYNDRIHKLRKNINVLVKSPNAKKTTVNVLRTKKLVVKNVFVLNAKIKYILNKLNRTNNLKVVTVKNKIALKMYFF